MRGVGLPYGFAAGRGSLLITFKLDFTGVGCASVMGASLGVAVILNGKGVAGGSTLCARREAGGLAKIPVGFVGAGSADAPRGFNGEAGAIDMRIRRAGLLLGFSKGLS